MRLSRSARWLEELWRTVKGVKPKLFLSLYSLLFGLLSLSFAAERAIRSDIEWAFRFCVVGATPLGAFALVVGGARKSWALEVLGLALAHANLAALLHTYGLGIFSLVAPLALFAASAHYVLFAHRNPGEPRRGYGSRPA